MYFVLQYYVLYLLKMSSCFTFIPISLPFLVASFFNDTFFLPNATVIVGMFSLSDSLTILSELSLTGILALCWYPNKLYYCSSLPKSIQNIQYFYRSNCFRFANSLLKVTATFSKYKGKIAKKSVSSKKK